MPYCVNCGAFVDGEDRFCYECGMDLSKYRKSNVKVEYSDETEEVFEKTPEPPVTNETKAETATEKSTVGYTIAPNAYSGQAGVQPQNSIESSVGVSQPKDAQSAKPKSAPKNDWAVVGYIMSLFGIFFLPLIPAYIFNIIALRRVKKYGARKRGLAVTGLVFTICWTLFWILFISVV